MSSLIATFVMCVFACAKKDPFDQATIEKDLKKRAAQDLYDAAETFTFVAPAHRRLSDQQIADFAQMTRLAARIRQVAEHRLNVQADRASAADDRFTRLGESFAAVGSIRSYATADLRAALSLGLNPREQQWVGHQIAAAIPLIERPRSLERDIAEKKAELDAEIDPLIAARRKDAYDRALSERDNWEAAQDPPVLANARLLLKHRGELQDLFPSIR